MHGFVLYRRFRKVLSLRSDRAVFVLGCYIANELGLCVVRWPYLNLSVADLDTCMLPSDNRYFSGSIEIRTRFYREALRKNVHADFYGLSNIDSVMTDFDPNS